MTLTEIEWIEMDAPRFWSRVYTLKAQTNCTLEQAIQAVQLSDRSTSNEENSPHSGDTNVYRHHSGISR